MTTAQRLGQEAFAEAIRLKALPETRDRIVDHARVLYPALPAFVAYTSTEMGNIVGIEKDGRRWVIYGHWVGGYVYDLTTILRETRRHKRMDWLVGGSAGTNCKNVWSVGLDYLKGRVHFDELERLMKGYKVLVGA